MSAAADGERARVRRPFEPEQAPPDAAARKRAERFADVELDVLAEQGNFERARVLLARRAATGAAGADVYLDAIRVERSAAPAGAAWQAWAARALGEGAEIAGTLAALVPERELCAYLVEQAGVWALLDRQRDRGAARALLRMRLEQQLRDDPIAALATIEEPALRQAAERDQALRVLAIGVMAGAAWDAPARVLALAESYRGTAPALRGGASSGTAPALRGGASSGTAPALRGGAPIGVDPNAATAGAPGEDAAETHARELLATAQRLQPAWSTATRATACPAALARFVRCAPLASRAGLARIARELLHDLRAQPAAYLRGADAIARAAPEFGAWLMRESHAARDALAASSGTAPALRGGASFDGAASDSAAAEHALADARAALRRAPLRRAWPVALALSAAAVLATWPWSGMARPCIALLALLAPWPLRRALDGWLFARVLRPALAGALVQHGVSLEALCAALRAPETPRGGPLAARAQRDPGLAIVAGATAFAHAESA